MASALLAAGSAVAAIGVLVAPLRAQQPNDALRLVVPVGHTGHVQSVAFSSDGRFVLTSGGEGTARIWETATGRELRTIAPARERVVDAVFAPGDTAIITMAMDVRRPGSFVARVWSVVDARPLRDLGRTDVATLAARGDVVATATAGALRVWNARMASPIVARSLPVSPTLFRWSTRGTTLAVAGGDSSLYILAEEGRRDAVRVGTVPSDVTALAASGDSLVVSGSADHVIRVWRRAASAGRAVTWHSTELPGHTGAIMALGITGDGRDLVSASGDGTIRIWDLASGAEREVRGTGGSVPTAGALSRDGAWMAVGAIDGSVRIVNLHAHRAARLLGGRTEVVSALDIASTGATMATAHGDHVVRVWDNASGRVLHLLAGHTARVKVVAFLPGDSLLVSAGDDGTTRVWDARTGRGSRSFADGGAPVFAAAMAPGGRRVATGSFDGVARVWEIGSGKLAPTLRHPAPVHAVVFLSDSMIVTGAADGRVRIWRVRDTLPARVFEAHRGRVVSGLALSPDARFLATAGADSTVRIWSLGPDTLVATLRLGELPVSVAFLRSSRSLVTAGRGSAAAIWDLDASTAAPLHRLEGHAGDLVAARVTPAGTQVITASVDGTTRVWNASDGALRLTRVATDGADWVAVAPDGRFDGSQRGIRRLHYASGLETLALDAFFARWFTPGLVGLVHADSTRDGPDVRLGFGQPPVVRILVDSSSEPGARAQVRVELRERGGGAFDVRLYQNGVLVRQREELGAEARLARAGCDTPCVPFEVDLVPGLNVIEATAFSDDGVEAERATATLIGRHSDAAARLIVLAVGIGAYPSLPPVEQLELAPVDARDVTRAITSGARGLFRDTVVVTLTDAAARRDGIVAAFRRMAQLAKPEDVFVFFYSGHGSVAGEGDSASFYLAAAGVDSLRSRRSLRQHGISAAEMRAMLDAVPALKKVLILDACRSGAQTAAFRTPTTLAPGDAGDARRALRSDHSAAREAVPLIIPPALAAQERAIAQLARSSGVFTISASTPAQQAQAFRELGHSAFSHALLEALGAAPHGEAQGEPRVRTLRVITAEVEQRVPELTRRHGGMPQYPYVWSFGQDFPLVVR